MDGAMSEVEKIVRSIAPYTMENQSRISSFAQIMQIVLNEGIPGDIVECGVWKGGMMMLAAKLALYHGHTDRTFWLYDTYTGMSRPQDVDVFMDGSHAIETWERSTSDGVTDWCLSPLEEVKANLASTGYPVDRIKFIQGQVEDTLPGVKPASIAVMRLDTDWYASTKVELEQLYSLLSPGGFFIVADFSDWQGSHKAAVEFFADKVGQIAVGVIGGTLVGRKLASPAGSSEPASAPTPGNQLQPIGPIELIAALHYPNVTGVLQVGASSGQEIPYFLTHGVAYAALIEPLDGPFAELRQRCAGLANYLPVQALCADSDGALLRFHVATNNGESSSLLMPTAHLRDFPWVGFPATLEMNGFTLDRIFQAINIARPDIAASINLLYIDVQGAELKVLKGANSLLRQVSYIYSEIGLGDGYADAVPLEDLIVFLRLHGFRLFHSTMGRQGWGNALFVRAIDR